MTFWTLDNHVMILSISRQFKIGPNCVVLQVNIARSKPPYGPCADLTGEDNDMVNLYSPDYGYSENACKKTCLQVTELFLEYCEVYKCADNTQ